MKQKRNTTSAGAWKDGRSWSTIDEMDFIDGLGTFSDAGKEIGRDELLKRYAQAMDARADWGTIDAARILQHLKHRGSEG